MNTIAEYSTTQAALSDLKARWTQIPDTNTKAGYELVKRGIKELSGYRSKLEAMRKDLKAPILERGKLLDSEAKRITAELLAIETPLKTAKQATDEREQREKEERIARLQVKVNELLNYPRQAQGASSAQIGALIDRLGEIDTTHDYYDLTTEAMDAQAASLDTLAELYKQQVAAEAESKRMAEERERQAIEQARLDAERQQMIKQQEALRQQQEAMQRQMAEQQAEMDRNAALIAEQQAERRIQAEEAEKQRQAEAAEAQEQARNEQQQIAQAQAEQRQIEAAEAMRANEEAERDSRGSVIGVTSSEVEPPSFAAPTRRVPLPDPKITFVNMERRVILATGSDRADLQQLLSDERISELAFDAEGNEYALEVTVSRVRIINVQAA